MPLWPRGHPRSGELLHCPFCWDKLQEEKRLAYNQKCIKRAQLPTKFLKATFDELDLWHPEAQKMVQAARDYAESWVEYFSDGGGFEREEPHPMEWLALFGGYGTGKTHLAAAIALTLAKVGHDVRYCYVPELLDELRRGYFEEVESEDGRSKGNRYYQLMEELKEVSWLILDDIGAEKATDWAGEQLDKLIDYRYRESLQLVVTSNAGMDSLPKRAADRLRDNSVCTRVVSKAPSYRPRKGRKQDAKTGD